MIRRIVERFCAVVRDEGIGAAVTKIAAVTRRSFRRTDGDNFDIALKTDTSTEVPLWNLKIPSGNAKFGHRYQATAPSDFLNAIRMVPANIEDFAFIDLGCGKGRTLILAAKQGFKKVIGVEFSLELAAVARENISHVGIRAEIIETDACQFSFPEDNLVIYMYNPFGGSVMHLIIRNLLEWRQRYANTVFVVYENPVCQTVFQSFPEFESVANRNRTRIWKLR